MGKLDHDDSAHYIECYCIFLYIIYIYIILFNFWFNGDTWPSFCVVCPKFVIEMCRHYDFFFLIKQDFIHIWQLPLQTVWHNFLCLCINVTLFHHPSFYSESQLWSHQWHQALTTKWLAELIIWNSSIWLLLFPTIFTLYLLVVTKLIMYSTPIQIHLITGWWSLVEITIVITYNGLLCAQPSFDWHNLAYSRDIILSENPKNPKYFQFWNRFCNNYVWNR